VAAASHGQACTRHRRAGIRLRHQQAGAWAWPSFFLFQNQCKHTEEANSAGRPSWQAGANLKPHTSLAFHTTNKLIDQQAGRIIHHTNSNPQRRPTAAAAAAAAAADACFLPSPVGSRVSD